jgi:hypothetical protein
MLTCSDCGRKTDDIKKQDAKCDAWWTRCTGTFRCPQNHANYDKDWDLDDAEWTDVRAIPLSAAPPAIANASAAAHIKPESLFFSSAASAAAPPSSAHAAAGKNPLLADQYAAQADPISQTFRCANCGQTKPLEGAKTKNVKGSLKYCCSECTAESSSYDDSDHSSGPYGIAGFTF